MAYLEIKERNDNAYYYWAASVRSSGKIMKNRIYLGKNLAKPELDKRIRSADKLLDACKKSKKLREILPKLRKILMQNHVTKAAIFGSYARGEEKKDSDIDILIEPPEGMGIEFIELRLKLESALGKKVDLVSYNGINPHLKRYLLDEEVRII
jgi:uncharacterized protein